MKPSILLLTALFVAPFAGRAEYFDFSNSSMSPQAGSGWSVDNADAVFGKALHCTKADSVIEVSAKLGQNSAATFLAKNSGTNAVRLFASGLAEPVLIPAGASWSRSRIDLSSLGTGEKVLSFSVSPDGGDSVNLFLDELYVGRTLPNSTLSERRVWNDVQTNEGILFKNEDSVYEGAWKHESTATTKWIREGDVFVLPTTNAAAGATRYFGSVFPLEPALSDTMEVFFDMKTGPVDSVVPIYSANNGNSWHEIGSYVSCGSEEFSVHADSDGWVTVTSSVRVPGLQGNGNVLVGFRGKAGGSGRTDVRIRHFGVTYRTEAEVSSAGFADGDGLLDAVSFGDDPFVGAVVSAPGDAVVDALTVSVVRPRVTDPVEFTLTNTVPGGAASGLWVSTERLSKGFDGRSLEAGETVTFETTLEYHSAEDIADASPDIRSFSRTAEGLGTVWINEVNVRDAWIEIAAPAWREFTGWSVKAVCGGETNEVCSEWSSSDGREVRGVSFYAIGNVEWPGGLSGRVSLQLVNSAGLVEHEVEMPADWSTGTVFSAAGELPFVGDDWVGVADRYFGSDNWTSGQSGTYGTTNATQTVALPVSFAIDVASPSNLVWVTVSLPLSGGTVSTQMLVSSTASEADGLYHAGPFTLSGTHNSDELPMTAVDVSGTVFGWRGVCRRTEDLHSGTSIMNRLDMDIVPAPGEEQFDVSWKTGRWKWTPSGKTVSWTWFDDGYVGLDGRFQLAGSNFGRLETETVVRQPVTGSSRRIAKFSVKIRDTEISAKFRMTPELVGSSETIVFAEMDNAPTGTAGGEWIDHVQWIPLTETQAEDGPYSLRLHAVQDVRSSWMYFDDVRLSLQDWVEISCAPTNPVPKPGETYGAIWTVSPGEGTAANVDVYLVSSFTHASRSSEWRTNLLFHADSLGGGEKHVATNDLMAVAGFTGQFEEGDTFSYYFVAEFDANNGLDGEREVSYHPDNRISSNGVFRCVGEYAPVPRSATAWGAQDVWINEIYRGYETHADGFVELAGRPEASIAGWTLVLFDRNANETERVTIPSEPEWAWAATNTDNHVAFYSVTGLSVPSIGGIQLWDAQAVPTLRYSLCYANRGEAIRSDFSHINDESNTHGLGAGVSLIALNEGNPANQSEWIWGRSTTGNSPNAANSNQDLTNLGPIKTEIAVTDIGPTNAGLAVFATDIDTPVSYSLAATALDPAGDATGVTFSAADLDANGRSTNTAWTATGLAQNTKYEFAVTPRDSLGEDGLRATTTNWTLLESWDVTNSVSADSVTVWFVNQEGANLGVGDTAWARVGDSASTGETLSFGRAALGASGPNVVQFLDFWARNGAGVPSLVTNRVSYYTLANKPTAAPGFEKQTASVRLSIPDGYSDGNPDTTRYAVEARMEKRDESGDFSFAKWNVEGGEWRTLQQWRDVFSRQEWSEDLTCSTSFRFVARNGDEVETEGDDLSEPVVFDFGVDAPDPGVQARDGSGLVSLAATVVNPFTNTLPTVSLAVEYSDDNGVSWADATIHSFQAEGATKEGSTLSDVTATNVTTDVSVVWDAKTDLGQRDVVGVLFRWTASAEGFQPVSGTNAVFDVRLKLPRIVSVKFAGSLANNYAKHADELPFTIRFDDAVSNVLDTAVTTMNGTVTRVYAPQLLSRAWTIYIEPSNKNAPDLEVGIASVSGNKALDEFGNPGEAWPPAGGSACTVRYDGKEPEVGLASTTPNRFNAESSPMVVTATFTEPVWGVTKDSLKKKENIVSVELASGTDGGTTFTFNVVVEENKQGTVSFPAGGEDGGVRDKAGNLCSAAQTDLSRFYDTDPPSVVLASTTPDRFNAERSPMVVTATFSEPVWGVTKDSLKKKENIVSVELASGTDGGTTFTFNVVVEENKQGTVSFPAGGEDGGVRDKAGNLCSAAQTDLSRFYDTEAPQLSSVTPVGFEPEAQSFNTTRLTLRYVFSEAVSGFDDPSIFDFVNIDPTCGIEFSSEDDGRVWTLTATPETPASIEEDTEGKVVVTLRDLSRVTDVAGNAATDPERIASFDRIWDRACPRVRLDTETTSPFSTNVFRVSFAFNKVMLLAGTNEADTAENVFPGTGIETIGCEIVPDSLTTTSVEHVSSSGKTWYSTTFELDFRATVSNGNVSVAVPANCCLSEARNPNDASSEPMNLVRDTDPPSVVLSSTTPNRFNAEQSPMVVTATFSEPVLGVTKDSLKKKENIVSVELVSGGDGDKVFTFNVVIKANKTGKVSFPAGGENGVVHDEAGNTCLAAKSDLSRFYDTQPPTVSVSVSPATTNYDGTATATITFSEKVKVPDGTGWIRAENGKVDGTPSSSDGITWTATIKASDANKDKDVTISVSVPRNGHIQDDAGNALGTDSDPASVDYRGERPKVTEVSTTVAPGFFSGSLPIAVLFSEPVESFTSEDLTVKVGNTVVTGVNPQPTGNAPAENWTFSVSPGNLDGEVTITVKTGGTVTDIHGNGLAAGKSLAGVYRYDSQNPELDLAGTPADGSTTTDGSFHFTATAIDANASAGLTLHWTLDGIPQDSQQKSGNGSVEFTISGSGLSEVEHTVSAWVEDASGRSSTTNEWSWTVGGREGFGCTIANPGGATIVADTATFTVTFATNLHEATPFTTNCLSWSGVTPKQLENLTVAVTPENDSLVTNFTVTVSGLAGDPSITALGLSVEEHVVENAEGIGNLAGETADGKRVEWVIVDNVPPVVGPLSASPSRAQSETDVVFSFDVTDENLESVTVMHGTETLQTETSPSARFSFSSKAKNNDGSFTIVARDRAGNATTNSAAKAANLAIDDAAPTITWSGVPSGTTNTAQFAATITKIQDYDPDVQFRWAIVEGTPATTNWSVAAGAAVGVRVARNGLAVGEHAFVVQAWDSAGNTNATSQAWTVAIPAAGESPELREPTSEDGVAEFTVEWSDETRSLVDGATTNFFLRANNLTVTDVDVAPGTDATSAIVTVTTADRSPGAFVELVVPAGALGGTNDAVQRVDFQVPVLTYIGRSLAEPNVLEWRLEGVDSVLPTDFRLFYPDGNAPTNVTTGRITKNAACVTNVSGNAQNGWIVKVDDRAWEYCTNLKEGDLQQKTAWSNAVWAANVFVNWRLVYTPAHLTNAGPAEVNLALDAFGASVNAQIIRDERNARNGSFEDQLSANVTNSSASTKIDIQAFGSVGNQDDTQRDWQVSFRSGQWVSENPGDVWCFIGRVFTNEEHKVSSCSGTNTLTSQIDGKWTVDFSMNINNCSNSKWNYLATTNAYQMAFRGWKNGAKIYEIGAMGAPAKYACEPIVPTVSLLDAVHSTGTLRLKVESLTAFRGVDENKVLVFQVPGLQVPSSRFSISNRTEKGFEIHATGMDGYEGDVEVTLEEGALWNTFHRSDATNATFHVDFKPPVIESFTAPNNADGGNAVFTIALSENASGMEGTNFLVAVTNAAGQAVGSGRVASLVRNGTNVTVNVHADRWESGAVLTLAYEGTLVDASGNANHAEGIASVALPDVPSPVVARKLTIAAGEGGTVSSTGTHCGTNDVSVSEIVVTPNVGWRFDKWIIDPAAAAITSLDNGKWTVSLAAGQTNATATSTFVPIDVVTVTVEAGPGGRASLPGTVRLPKGASTNVTFYADTGYQIESVKIGSVGVSGAGGKTEFMLQLDSLNNDTTVAATFKKKAVRIEWIEKANGSVVGGSWTTVDYNVNWSAPFAKEGCTIHSITVKGGNLSRPPEGEALANAAGATSYTVQLFGVVKDAEIEVEYAAAEIPWTPVFITEMKMEGNRILLSFDRVTNGMERVRIRAISAETLEELLNGPNATSDPVEVSEGVPSVAIDIDGDSGFFRLEAQERKQ